MDSVVMATNNYAHEQEVEKDRGEGRAGVIRGSRRKLNLLHGGDPAAISLVVSGWRGWGGVSTLRWSTICSMTDEGRGKTLRGDMRYCSGFVLFSSLRLCHVMGGICGFTLTVKRQDFSHTPAASCLCIQSGTGEVKCRKHLVLHCASTHNLIKHCDSSSALKDTGWFA